MFEAAARFLVARGQPLLVLDIEGPAPSGPTFEVGLYRALLEGGLVVMERFFGVDLPRGARLGWVVDATELRLETEAGDRLVRVPRGSVDQAWLAAATRLRGTMLVVGHELGLDPDEAPGAVAARIEAAARSRNVAAAIVGLGLVDEEPDLFALPLLI